MKAVITKHALDRWKERVKRPIHQMERAIAKARKLHTLVGGPDAPDLYLYKKYDVVFMIRDGVVITVMRTREVTYG